MSDINKDVGFNIRRMREEKGLTQDKLDGLEGAKPLRPSADVVP
ncbi:MAG TPA: hypothetical protein VMX13_04770 [Sedimentisphaerales bacterium]|nr:hypothetical protein [Sedimentisphaerales bacterium]